MARSYPLSLLSRWSLVFGLFACSSSETTPAAADATAPPSASAAIEVTDDPTPLTSNPGDDLFRVKLTAGGPYALSELSVTIQFGSGSPATFGNLTFVDDANKNQKLDVGDVFLVNEGNGTPIGEGYASQSATVSLVRAGKVIAVGTWNVKS